MTFQFTGQIPLDSRDIKKSSKAVGSRFHFAKNLRRLPFELDPVNHVFDVSANTTNNASESVVLKTPVHLHKNSLHYQGNIESFPGIDDPSAQPFDGFIQSFGELSAVQLGFWLEG